MENLAIRASEYLSFKPGGEKYGMDIRRVQEIRSFEPPTRMAHAPAHISSPQSVAIRC